MKTLTQIITIAFVVLFAVSCKSVKLSNNYETQAMGQGKQGTILMKVFSYGETVEEATERAKMDAVHAIIFKGVPGSNVSKPLLSDPSLEQSRNDYFLDFFGVDNWLDRSNTRSNRKMRYGKDSAPYRSFVMISSDGSIGTGDRLKVPGGYKVGVVVSVMHAQLRRKLEQDGLARKFGL